MITMILAGVFTIGAIIFIHELGHFLAARAVGVHVHRFSLGFGPVLLGWRSRRGTQFALSLFPIGGYVRMAGMELAPLEGGDDDEKVLPPESLYRNRPWLARFFVILAGPLANLVLALVIAVGLLHHGGQNIFPGTWLGEPVVGSAAAEAGLMRGDRILALGGVEVSNWSELDALVREGEPEILSLSVAREGEILGVELAAGEGGWGLIPILDNRVGKILRGGPADRAGLKEGDRILEVGGAPVRFFDEIAGIINTRAGEELRLVWETDGQRREAVVLVEAAEVPGADGGMESIGRIYFEPYLENRPLSWGESLQGGVAQVAFYVAATVDFLIHLPSQGGSVGGPILIFKTAGEMVGWGFERLLIFIAFFSTQLCLLNLLPIPVLDGGHILLLIPELFGVKVNETLRLRLTQAGMMLLLGIMALVVLLDIRRLFGG